MDWPQITLLILYALGGGIHLTRDGETTTYSFGGWALSAAILLGLLWAGGFFSQ